MAEALQVSPEKLRFAIQLGKLSTAKLTLTNPNSVRVGFKMQTTTKLYSVSPTAGVLPPGGSCVLDVTRGKAKKEQLPGEGKKCKVSEQLAWRH